MISFLPAFIKAPIAAALFALNTLLACLFIFPVALVKFLFPNRKVKDACTAIMIRIGEIWISDNNLNMKFTQNIKWDITGVEGLSRDKSYLVFSNHQSWMDIVILQHVFNGKIPFIRFFLKYELIYVPLLGWAWWALDFPFMKRHSKAYLKKYPERRNEDFESTRKACEVFKGKHVTVLNFLEGTRFTPEKHKRLQPPFENLLSPKAGGLAFVLNAMGEQFDSILDVSIYYPKGPVGLWGAFEGKLPEVVVHVNQIPIPHQHLNGNYLEDREYRVAIQAWVQELWKQKDVRISSLKK